jgi:hypothetical protein
MRSLLLVEGEEFRDDDDDFRPPVGVVGTTPDRRADRRLDGDFGVSEGGAKRSSIALSPSGSRSWDDDRDLWRISSRLDLRSVVPLLLRLLTFPRSPDLGLRRSRDRDLVVVTPPSSSFDLLRVDDNPLLLRLFLPRSPDDFE